MYSSPPNTEAENGSAIGWISIAELFLIVGALLLASVGVYQFHLANATAQNARLVQDERQLREENVTLLAEAERLRARLRMVEDRDQVLAVAQQKIQELEKQAALLRENLGRVRQQLEQVQARLQETEEERNRYRAREASLAADLKKAKLEVEAIKKDLQEVRGRLQEEVAKAKKLEAEREDLRIALLRAEGEQKHLEQKLQETIKSFQNRFEGIPLDGERVVFLIDRSGSMGYVDRKTKAPDKWPSLCETVGRIMRSLPGLKQFQVITFADDVAFPLGKKNVWIDYETGKTAVQVVHQLKQVETKSITNLYLGFETAFKFRDQGLDTIYLFSDGLPNDGPGGTKQQREQIAELEKQEPQRAEVALGELLGGHLRKTIREDWNHQKKVHINSVGFFYESPDLGSFLWALSRENAGNFVGMSKP